MVRVIDRIIIHCADTREDNLVTLKNEDMDVGVIEIEAWHKARAEKERWNEYVDKKGVTKFIGYHWVVRRDGTIEMARPEGVIGCHTVGYNSRSIAICWIGRNRLTPAARAGLIHITAEKCEAYGLDTKQIFGHCEIKGVKKTCPNFNQSMTYVSMDSFRADVELYLNRNLQRR